MCYLIVSNAFGHAPISNAIATAFTMLPYCIYAWVQAQKTGQHDDFGDSCYFLGFLLTLVALVVSLIAFDASGNNTALIISQFGAAISTTLVGMLARIMIAQFHDQIITGPEQAEAQIAVTMGKLARELDESLGHFKNLRSNTVNNINQATKAAETRINNAVEAQLEVTEKFTTEAFERHARIIDDLQKNLGTIVIDTGPLKESLEEAMGTIEKQMARLGDVLSNLGDAGAESEHQWAGLKDRLAAITDVLDQLQSSSKGLQDSGAQLRKAGDSIFEATKAFGSTENIIEKLTDTLEQSNQTIEAMKNGVAQNLRDIEALRSLIGDEHAAAAKTTEEVYNRLARALELAAVKLERAGEENG